MWKALFIMVSVSIWFVIFITGVILFTFIFVLSYVIMLPLFYFYSLVVLVRKVIVWREVKNASNFVSEIEKQTASKYII